MTDDDSRELKDSYLRLRSYINSDGKYIIWLNEDDDQMWANLGETETMGTRPMELREQALSDLRNLVIYIRDLEEALLVFSGSVQRKGLSSGGTDSDTFRKAWKTVDAIVDRFNRD